MFDEQITTLITRAKEHNIGMRTDAHMPERKRVSLMATDGPAKGQTFPITRPQVLLGRLSPPGQSEADVAINDSKISRKHCVLEIHGQTVLVDLDSANGTYVGGEKIEVSQLTHFSDFQIGNTTLILTII